MGRWLRILGYLVALFRHRATPWYIKGLMGLAVLYAVLPQDLIPDYLIPVGWLDDVVLVPLMLALAMRLAPPAIATELRQRFAERRTS